MADIYLLKLAIVLLYFCTASSFTVSLNSLSPVLLDILLISSDSESLQRVKEVPELPARAVLPIL
jgi:hypothetical protein